jgi:hypothetical protein
MGDLEYSRLKERLPEMAAVIKEFETAALQERVLDALVRALESAESQGNEHRAIGHQNPRQASKPPKAAEKAASHRTRRVPPTVVRGLNFRPSGAAKGFKEFAAEKSPTNQDEQNTVAVFYMTEFMDVQQIGVGHVLAAYREAGWKPASNPSHSLRKTASAKGWIDTSSTDNIRMMPSGSYYVEHELPSENGSAP